LILRCLAFLTEPVPRRGYYNKGPYDADAEAVMAKTHWERMEEQELTGMPSHDKPSHDKPSPADSSLVPLYHQTCRMFHMKFLQQ
jgi:hypothetical protein